MGSNKPRLTPKQKKLRKQAKKRKLQAEKTARLLESPTFSRSPRSAEYIPEFRKAPRKKIDPGSIMSDLMRWCPLQADKEGDWSWGQPRQWSSEDWGQEILPKLNEFEKLKWSEIYAQRTGNKKKKRHKKHHDMAVCNIEREACDRWYEIGLEEHDTAFRFRLAGIRRLWGYRILAKFYLIWWDPYHKIYPVEVH